MPQDLYPDFAGLVCCCCLFAVAVVVVVVIQALQVKDQEVLQRKRARRPRQTITVQSVSDSN